MSRPTSRRAVAARTLVSVSALLAVAGAGALPAQDLHWAGFRGTAHDGVADAGARPPARWSADSNLAWKKELPGPGSSSPIIVGDRVFVYCYSGYGNHLGDGGDPKKLMHHVLSFDRRTGDAKDAESGISPG